MSAINKLAVLLLLISNVGECAFKVRNQVYQNMAISGALGAAYGYSRQNCRNTYATLYGSLGAALAAAASFYLLDPDKQVANLEKENQQLKASLDQFQNPRVLYEAPGTFNSKIPDKYRKLIQPGEWRVSEIDQWTEESENRIIHQDKIMELIPPSLIPNLNQGN